MQYLNNRIPPPIIALICALLTWASAQYKASIVFERDTFLALSGLLLITGISFATLGIVCFKAAKTTINPLHPKATSVLVNTGIYRISRNPMYVGMAMVLTAWSLYLSSLTGLIGLVIFIIYINQFQIKPEEQALSTLFGESFTQYTSQVRRWL